MVRDKVAPFHFTIGALPPCRTERPDPNISDLQKYSGHHKLAAFADDLISLVSNPHISLPNILQVLSTYSAPSNLKINLVILAALIIITFFSSELLHSFISTELTNRLNIWMFISLETPKTYIP